MANTGETIENAVTGERITFLKTARDTGGEFVLFECRVSPGGISLPAHVHGGQDERIEVGAGTLGVVLGKQMRTLRRGDDVCLPAGVAHQWWNAGGEELLMRVSVAPAGNFEAALKLLSRMAAEGRVARDGLPVAMLDLASLLRLSEIYMPGVPIWLQKGFLFSIDVVGHAMEYGEAFAAALSPTGRALRPAVAHSPSALGTRRPTTRMKSASDADLRHAA